MLRGCHRIAISLRALLPRPTGGGTALSKALSIEEGQAAAPSMGKDKVSQGRFSLSLKLLDLGHHSQVSGQGGRIPGPGSVMPIVWEVQAFDMFLWQNIHWSVLS